MHLWGDSETKNSGKQILPLAIICVIAFLVLNPPIVAGYSEEEVITPQLQSVFSSYDGDHNHALDWVEARNFYNWVESAIQYRYDDESDPEGQMALDYGWITSSQLGDGRSGNDYWQKPAETYVERYGDCEDMAILELAFYNYYNIDSHLGIVDVDGDGVIDHAICIAAFSEEAFQQLVDQQGIVQYYSLNGTKFVIVDNAYSSAYGFVGTYDPITDLPVSDREIDFTLYDTRTLEQIYNEHWQTQQQPTSPTFVIAIAGCAAIAIVAALYSIRKKRVHQEVPAATDELAETTNKMSRLPGRGN